MACTFKCARDVLSARPRRGRAQASGRELVFPDRLAEIDLLRPRRGTRQRAGTAADDRATDDADRPADQANSGASGGTGGRATLDGILLRADLHRLLDAGLLRIEDGVVRVSAGGYVQYDGQVVSGPQRSLPRGG